MNPRFWRSTPSRSSVTAHRWWDLADLAAAYLVGFARSQGFRDGNKRTGLACALVFLALNGAHLHVPLAELLALTMAVANNQADDTTVAAYFRDRLKSPTG